MSDHTPTTAAVRSAYIWAMRNAHLTSTGEAGVEFDRWLATHQPAPADYNLSRYNNAALFRLIYRAKTIMQARSNEGITSCPTQISSSPAGGAATTN